MDKNKLEFLLSGFSRIESLRYTYNVNLDSLSEGIKFLLLKEIIISCFELLPKPFLESHCNKVGLNKDDSAKLNLARIVRHLLVHFPIFNRADDIFFNYDVINLDNTQREIQKYFLHQQNRKGIAIEIQFNPKDKFNFHDKIVGTLKYAEFSSGKNIFLKDIISVSYPSDSGENSLYVIAFLSITLLQEYIRSEEHNFPERIKWEK